MKKLSRIIIGIILLGSAITASAFSFSDIFNSKLLGGGSGTVTNLPIKSFLGLNDTPNSYLGQATKAVTVKADETGLEFSTITSGSGTTTWGTIIGALSDQTDLQNALDDLVPYTGATGDVNIGSHELITSALKANSSAGIAITGSGGGTAALFGAGGGNNATFYDGVKLDAGTASRVLVTDSSKNIAYATMTASDLDAIPTTYAKLDGTNQPFTGDLEIEKTAPKLLLTDEDGESSVLKRESSSNTTSLTAEVIQTAGPGNAISLSGQYASISNPFGTTDATIVFWYKPTSNSGTKNIISFGNTTTESSPYLFLRNNAGTLEAYTQSGSYKTLSAVSVGTYYFITLRIDDAGNKVYFYINSSTSGYNHPIGSGNQTNFYVGTGFGGTISGDLDQMIGWSRQLTDAEIGDLYNSGTGYLVEVGNNFPSTGTPFATNLLALWSYDETSGTTASDSSGNGRNLSFTGASWTTGKVLTASALVTAIPIKYTDGVGQSERGMLTIGDYSGTAGSNNVYEGIQHKFNLLGSTKLTLNSTALTNTLPYYAPNGAVATPSYTFTNDTDTGLYSDGSGGIALGTSGVIRAQVTSAGNFIFNTGGFNFLSLNSTSVGIGGKYNTNTETFGVQNTGGATTRVTSVFKAVASQTADITEWQNSAGGIMTQIAALGGLTVNEQGSDTDSRFEGDTDANLLFVDAGADRIGIGTASPSAKLHIYSTMAEDRMENLVGYTRLNKTTGEHTTTRYNQTVEPSGASYDDSDTSYANEGGTGDRQSLITVTSNISVSSGGTWQNVVNGNKTTDLFYTQAPSASGKYIQFYFNGASKGITEAKYYQSYNSNNGTWKWQGSDNGTDWTDIGSSFSISGGTTITMTELSGNTTFYQYYRLYGISGTWNATGVAYQMEFEFKIVDGSGTEREIQVWKSEDGDEAGTYGVTTFGDENAKNVISGQLTTITSDTIFSGSGKGLPYGSMYIYNLGVGSTTVTVSAADTWYEIDSGIATGTTNLVTFQNGHELLVTKAGTYKIDWSMSVEDGGNSEIEGTVFINSIANTSFASMMETQAANKAYPMSGTGIITLAANDVVSLGVLNHSGTTNITIDHLTLSLVQIGG